MGSGSYSGKFDSLSRWGDLAFRDVDAPEDGDSYWDHDFPLPQGDGRLWDIARSLEKGDLIEVEVSFDTDPYMIEGIVKINEDPKRLHKRIEELEGKVQTLERQFEELRQLYNNSAVTRVSLKDMK